MVAVLVREGVVKTVLQKFSIRNCQLPTIKIESKNYGKSDFGCCIPQTYYSLSELSKIFEEFFKKYVTQTKTDAFNV